MALQTQLRLCLLQPCIFGEWRIVAGFFRSADVHSLFYLVAIDAGHSARFMRTPLPEHMRSPPMARFAGGILFGDGIRGVLTKANGDGVLAAAGFHVDLTGPMATFASA